MESSGKFEEMSIDNMVEDLEQYYEATGFTDFYQQELKNKTEDEIRELYRSSFDDSISKNCALIL